MLQMQEVLDRGEERMAEGVLKVCGIEFTKKSKIIERSVVILTSVRPHAGWRFLEKEKIGSVMFPATPCPGWVPRTGEVAIKPSSKEEVTK